MGLQGEKKFDAKCQVLNFGLQRQLMQRKDLAQHILKKSGIVLSCTNQLHITELIIAQYRN